MTGNSGGIYLGVQGPLSFPQVLGEAPYGGNDERVLRRTLKWGERGATGVTAVDHHLQCGGGRSVLPL